MVEYELTDMRKESKDPESKIELYAMVDLENQHVYGLKVITHCIDIVMVVTMLGHCVWYSGCHSYSHIKCHRVLPSAERGLHWF